MNKQPKAIRIAEDIRLYFNEYDFLVKEAESELRRLNAVNQELLSTLKFIVEETDGRNHCNIGQDRAFSMARTAITKVEATK